MASDLTATDSVTANDLRIKDRFATAGRSVASRAWWSTSAADAIVERLRSSGGRMTRPRADGHRRPGSQPQPPPDGVGHRRHRSAPRTRVLREHRVPDARRAGRTRHRRTGPARTRRCRVSPAARPHHHLVCESCGDVLEIPAALLDDLATRLHDEHGFRLRPSASTLVGSCARCETGSGNGLTARGSAR